MNDGLKCSASGFLDERRRVRQAPLLHPRGGDARWRPMNGDGHEVRQQLQSPCSRAASHQGVRTDDEAGDRESSVRAHHIGTKASRQLAPQAPARPSARRRRQRNPSAATATAARPHLGGRPLKLAASQLQVVPVWEQATRGEGVSVARVRARPSAQRAGEQRRERRTMNGVERGIAQQRKPRRGHQPGQRARQHGEPRRGAAQRESASARGAGACRTSGRGWQQARYSLGPRAGCERCHVIVRPRAARGRLRATTTAPSSSTL